MLNTPAYTTQHQKVLDWLANPLILIVRDWNLIIQKKTAKQFPRRPILPPMNSSFQFRTQSTWMVYKVF